MNIITLKHGYDAGIVRQQLQALGLWTTLLEAPDQPHVQLLVQAHSSAVNRVQIEAISGVKTLWSASSSHPLVDTLEPTSKVSVHTRVGADAPPILMAGPCSVESEEQIHTSAKMVSGAGATFLRGGCFKPRTSPYSFRGVGSKGLLWMRQAADAYGLLVVTEAMAPRQVEAVATHADVFQIGARNMQNFDLLHAVGRTKMPVLLKRGLSATLNEWLMAAEHVLHAGASTVIFCERGIRSFDEQTRFLLDLAAVAIMCDQYKLPIIVDPSHAAGRKDLLTKLGLAALATGAHGLIVEAHPEPGIACSDGPQQLNPRELQHAASCWGFGANHNTSHALI